MSALNDGALLRREVRRLAIPAIAHQLLQTLVFVVDRVMLGHHGESSLAAMQIAGPLEWSVWSVFSAFTVGTIARVGRYVGAKDRERARRAAILSLGLAFVLGLVVLALTGPALALLPAVYPRASFAVLVEARGYLGYALPASPVVFLGTASIAALQAGGDTKTPLAIGVFANALHVAMNRVLILGAFGVPALGARGAGISTAITFAVVGALALLALARESGAVTLRRGGRSRSADGDYSREASALLHVAGPAVVERTLYHAGYVGFVAVIGLLGDAAMAANQALISVESVCFLSGDGFGIAAAAIVAQKLGARLPREAGRATRIAARDAIALLTTMGLLFLATRALVLPMFSRDASVVAIGAAAVPVLAVAQPFMATSVVTADALRGGGFTRAVLGVSTASALVVRIAATWLFAITLGLGLVGVWMGSTADWIVRTVLLVVIGRRAERAAGG